VEYAEFRRHLGKAGLSINEFAALVDVRPSSVSNYSKKPAVPRIYAIAAVLLGDAADRQIPFRDVLMRYGIRFRLHAVAKAIASLDHYRNRPVNSAIGAGKQKPKAES
jgi:hypothetical protein